MARTEVCKVLVGEKRMILCRLRDLRKVDTEELVRTAYPEVYPSVVKKYFTIVPDQARHHYGLYLSDFDAVIDTLELFHNWNIEPFVALTLRNIGGKERCSAETIEMIQRSTA